MTGLFAADTAHALLPSAYDAPTTVTPRSNSGATPTTAVFGNSSGSRTSSTSSTTVSDSGSTESNTAATSSGRKHRHTTQMETASRHRSGGSATVSTSKGGGKAVVENKDKVVTPVSTAPPKVQFSLSGGYESRYIYHGLDIISFDSKLGSVDDFFNNRTNSSAITYENADMSFMGAHVGLGYTRALSPTYPYFQSPKLLDVFNSIAVTDKNTNDYPNGFAEASGQVNHRRFFQEVDLNLDYTVSLYANWIDGTVGYDSYFFPYRDFRGISYQGNMFARLALTRIKYIKPSVNFFHYFAKDAQSSDGFGDVERIDANGSYMEFRVDGAFPVINRPTFGLLLEPYIAAGYNINYLRQTEKFSASSEKDPNENNALFSGQLTSVGGWNDLEVGMKLTTRIGSHVTITPYGNYGVNLAGDDQTRINNLGGQIHTYGERTRFWGGVTVAYNF